MRIVSAANGVPTTPTVPSAGGPEIDALEAVRLFSRTGSLAKVAEELDVPIYELKKLSRTEFWQRELMELQRAEAALQNVQLTTILDSTLSAMEDRVKNGDFYVAKGGKVGRSPLNAATLARVADSVFNMRQLLREQPTSIVDVENKKLSNLAAQLRALGAKDVSLLDIAVPQIERAALPSQERALAPQ